MVRVGSLDTELGETHEYWVLDDRTRGFRRGVPSRQALQERRQVAGVSGLMPGHRLILVTERCVVTGTPLTAVASRCERHCPRTHHP
jgi:hypothetical protein